jgi:ATP-dependent Clp protease ATP-binding subunit ClpA|tara:strand:- start:69480 stop:71843 length:2364 start_codon:yes stop_codon:yes gene_type:complete
MSKNITFKDIRDITNFIRKNREELPKEEYNSIDLLILLGRIYPSAFSAALEQCGVNAEKLDEELYTIYDLNLKNAVKAPAADQVKFSDEFANKFSTLDAHIKFDDNDFQVFDLINAIFTYDDMGAGMILQASQHGSTVDSETITLQAEDIMKNGLSGTTIIYSEKGEAAPMNASAKPQSTKTDEDDDFSPSDVLENLVDLAMDEKLSPVIGREDELQQVVQVLLRKKKSNPLIVGEPGTGKTAVVEALAQAIAEDDVPDKLKLRAVLSLDMGGLLAGTRLRGMFEERLQAVLEFVAKENAILFIDETHMVMGAGTSGDKDMDMSNMLKPYLSAGTISVIGATTFKEAKKLEQDKAFMRRFGLVQVNEPKPELAVEMIAGQIASYESHHEGVGVDDSAIQAAVELSHRYIRDAFLPDKALSLLDDAMAAQSAKAAPEGAERGVVTEVDIYAQISKKLGRTMSKKNDKAEQKKLLSLTSEFTKAVLHQDNAIDKITFAIQNAKSDLFDDRKNKTLGSFLFSGPTGVGKTELANKMSDVLDVPLLRFDMSEFQDKEAVNRLIGAPPGYNGSAQGGELVNAVRKNPHAIVLFDEIEKAHPDVYKLLLQVMDNGKLTASNGDIGDFQNCYVTMTTNAGATIKPKRSIGFAGGQEKVNPEKTEHLLERFSEEFIARLDEQIEFEPLNDVNKVLDILEMKLAPRIEDLTAKNINVTFDNAAKRFLADKCVAQNLGIRPLINVIKTYFQKAVMTEYLEGNIKPGDTLKVRGPLNKSDDALRIEPQKTPKRAPQYN